MPRLIETKFAGQTPRKLVACLGLFVATCSLIGLASAASHHQQVVTWKWPVQDDKQLASLASLARLKRRTTAASKTSSNQSPPEFSAPIGNITAVVGRDVRLVCTVENLGPHQVAWLKEESKTILSIDTNIIITNYRIFLIPDEEKRKWVLHIRDVQESDRGYYQCQVNTNPMRSTSGYLEVVVPPNIVESQSSQVVELAEHSNASIQCKANGHPRPMISWHREDGQPIRLSASAVRAHQNNSTTQSQLFETIKSDKLTLVDVDRTMAGLYVCLATNGIPSQVSKRIPLFVKFAPKVSVQNKYISVSLNEQLELDCLIEAFPKPNSYWSKQRYSGEPLGGGQHWSSSSSWPSSNNDQNAISFRRNKPIYEQISSSARLQAVQHQDDTGQPPGEPTAEAMERAESSLEMNEKNGRYVSVKQIAVNSYTYKLKLTIARMHLADYGQYSCISSNSMGQSEAHVIITRADKIDLTRQRGVDTQTSINSDQDNDQYQRDSLIESVPSNPTSFVKPDGYANNQGISQRARSGQHITNRIVVYDENYLQAIKTRTQANGGAFAPTNKLQEKLRMKPDGNSANPSRIVSVNSVICLAGLTYWINFIYFRQ